VVSRNTDTELGGVVGSNSRHSNWKASYTLQKATFDPLNFVITNFQY